LPNFQMMADRGGGREGGEGGEMVKLGNGQMVK
jgi:hypothetical protein